MVRDLATMYRSALEPFDLLQNEYLRPIPRGQTEWFMRLSHLMLASARSKMRVILPLRPLFGFMASYLCAGSTPSKLITASQDVAASGSRHCLCLYHRPVPAECTWAGIAHLITDMLDLFTALARWRGLWTRIRMCPFYWQYKWSRSGCICHIT